MKQLVLLALLAGLAATGCQTQQIAQQCQESDWFEIGRRDGAQGGVAKHEELDLVPIVCEASDVAEESDNYTNGYNAGLVEYCRGESAFSLGRTQQNANAKVCPEQLQVEFAAAYERGTTVYKLEQEAVDLQKQRDSLAAELISSKSKTVRQKLAQIEQRQEQTQQQIEDLSLSEDI